LNLRVILFGQFRPRKKKIEKRRFSMVGVASKMGLSAGAMRVLQMRGLFALRTELTRLAPEEEPRTNDE